MLDRLLGTVGVCFDVPVDDMVHEEPLVVLVVAVAIFVGVLILFAVIAEFVLSVGDSCFLFGLNSSNL